MTTQESKHHSAREMVQALEVVRDRARVQAHLFSLDAKKRWRSLETSLDTLKFKLEQGGDYIATNAAAGFREVVKGAKQLMHELDGTLELTDPVRNLMKESPRTCSPEDSLEQAAQILWELDCGAVPIVGSNGSVAGIITDRDICMAAYTRGQPLRAMTIESTMSKAVSSCSPEDSIGHALRVMAEIRVRRLPVIENGRLVGVLTLADIARDIRKHTGSRIPASVALADALAIISEARPPSAARAQAAE